MSWDKILKNRSNTDEIHNILNYYGQLQSIVNDINADMIPLSALLENGDFEQANAEWEKMRGGIMDLEGTMDGVKEVNTFITNLLGDA